MLHKSFTGATRDPEISFYLILNINEQMLPAYFSKMGPLKLEITCSHPSKKVKNLNSRHKWN